MNTLDPIEYQMEKKKIPAYSELFKLRMEGHKIGSNKLSFVEKTHDNKKNYLPIKYTDLNRRMCIKISNKSEDGKVPISLLSVSTDDSLGGNFGKHMST